MSLCFIEPQGRHPRDRGVGRPRGPPAAARRSSCAPGSTRSRRPSSVSHYAKAWPTSTSTTSRCSPPGTPRWRSATPLANKDFLVGAFKTPGREPPRGAEDRRGPPRRGRVQRGRGRGAGAGERAAVALAERADGARWPSASSSTAGTGSAARTERPAPSRDDRGGEVAAASASISAIACAVSRNRTACMPSARAASQLTSMSSRNTHSLAGSAEPLRASARRSPARACACPRSPSRRPARRCSSTGSIVRQRGSHSRTLLVRIAMP